MDGKKHVRNQNDIFKMTNHQYPEGKRDSLTKNTKICKKSIFFSEFQNLISELNESETIERQLEVIKKISKCQQKKGAIELLTDIYFLSKLKHPIKKGIARYFFFISSHSLNNIFHHFSVLSQMKNDEELVVDSIKMKIASEIEKVSGSCLQSKNYVVSSINESLQNFKPAISAIGKSTNILLQFILKYLEDLYVELR